MLDFEIINDNMVVHKISGYNICSHVLREKHFIDCENCKDEKTMINGFGYFVIGLMWK